MSTLDWRDDGACTGMTETHGAQEVAAIFFPERGASLRRAKAICAECPVRERCLEHALTEPEKHGVWGGTSEKERRVMRRNRLADGTLSRASKPIEHGTRAGYARCQRRPEGPCRMCLDASARWQKPDPGLPDYYDRIYSEAKSRKRLADLDEVAS